ncbi:MAG TPA: peptidoglycan DD-metalloendopeptidase family protein [Actinotalea sp.]|nr:peptidoglycan DD-metalloendopeptidase family protein [Actinotalea sp.]
MPSHGGDRVGGRFAVDFVGGGERGRPSGTIDWRTLVASEPAERFVGFGRPILAPASGTVVLTHDGEVDHPAHRSVPAGLRYLSGQRARLERGIAALAGNHVVIEVPGAYVALVHLQQGSLRVGPGDPVVAGEQLAACGNSGNSTQPHVHVQAMDGPDARAARGLPIAFRTYREWPAGGSAASVHALGVPGEGSVVEPVDQ